MSNTYDASIPVLTEVLHDEPSAAPAPLAALNAVPDMVASAPLAAAGAPPGEQREPSVDLDALERRLSERILGQLQSRVDFVLEQRLKDCMEDVINHALRGLTDEIRHGLHDTLGKIVTRAVAQEIAHLQAHSVPHSAPQKN